MTSIQQRKNNTEFVGPKKLSAFFETWIVLTLEIMEHVDTSRAGNLAKSKTACADPLYAPMCATQSNQYYELSL